MANIHNSSSSLLSALLCTAAIAAVLIAPSAEAQQTERWFQIEVSIFSNESILDRSLEIWSPEQLDLSYPAQLSRLDLLTDLLLSEDYFAVPEQQLEPVEDELNGQLEELTEPQLQRQLLDQQAERDRQEILTTGPVAQRQLGDFKFFDLERDAYLQLPSSASDFQQTNRALERSADYRLLYHGLWRQVVVKEDAAMALFVSGGLSYGEHHELEGSITVRFNDNEDRVVLDANLWLNEFTAAMNLQDRESAWEIPAIPAPFRQAERQSENSAPIALVSTQPAIEYAVRQVYQLKQSREMRSTEFHYLDHPAMGIVIMVLPYEVPEIPVEGVDIIDADVADLDN